MITSGKRRLWLRRSGAAALGAVIARPAPAQLALEPLVTIGYAGALGSKSLSNIALSARDGAQLAVDQINQGSQGSQGSGPGNPQRRLVIGGQLTRLSLLALDDQSDVNFARLAANAFVNAQVAAVIGHDTTETSVATSAAYADAGIPQITATATGRQLTNRNFNNVFQLLGNSDSTTTYLTEVCTGLIGARRIAVLENGTSLGAALADGVIQKLRIQGSEVLGRDAVSPKTSDFNAVLQRVKNGNADLLFFTGGGPQIEPLLLNLRRLELSCRLLVTGGAINLDFPRSGNYPEGSYLLTHGLPPDKRPGYAEFEKAYRLRYDTAISGYTMFAYDAVGMLADAMRRLDSSNARLLIGELHRMKYKGISGNIAFHADGSQVNPPYTLYQASEGRWRALRSWGG